MLIDHLFCQSKISKGFTLIELVVSIAILAVISTFVITSLNPFEQFLKAQDARRKSDLSQIQKALETYYQDNGRYPYTTGNTGAAETMYRIQTNEPSPDDVKDWGDSWGGYIEILPEDTSGRQYIYNVSTDGQSYWLYASLERGAYDPQACNSGDVCSNVPPNSSTPVKCGANTTHTCNYGVSSTNVSP